MLQNTFVLIAKCICPKEPGVVNLSFLACVAGWGSWLYWQACLRNNLPSSWHLTLATPIIRQSMITHSLLTFSSYSSLQRTDIHHKTNYHNHHIHHDLPFFRSWQNTLVLHGVKQEANCGYESSECTDAKVLD